MRSAAPFPTSPRVSPVPVTSTTDLEPDLEHVQGLTAEPGEEAGDGAGLGVLPAAELGRRRVIAHHSGTLWDTDGL